MVQSTIQIRQRLPFGIKGFHTDGGSEFINQLLYEYLSAPKDFVVQTHGRPYRKNDQARVEQRNWTHVRQLFGYERISEQRHVNMMNDIYRNEWRLLNNFFTATRKQISKTRVGSKFKRSFDKARSPYERVLDDKSVSDFEKVKLKKTFDSLNPFELKKSLDKKMRDFERALKELKTAADQNKKEAA